MRPSTALRYAYENNGKVRVPCYARFVGGPMEVDEVAPWLVSHGLLYRYYYGWAHQTFRLTSKGFHFMRNRPISTP